MRRLAARALLAACLAIVTVDAHAGGEASLVGRWLTPDGEGVIEISRCGDGLCGRIVGMDETTGRDGKPSINRSGVAQCGLTILKLPSRDADGVWAGEIENPNDGSFWRCHVWRDAKGVHLRGYVLTPLLGRTQLWTPYAATLAADCAMPATSAH